MSIFIVSPSSTTAITPPTAASGEMWPIAAPSVKPEKRPSVSTKTSCPMPRPTSASVVIIISRIPGAPRGPS